jgi:hypothetical protein
MTLAFVIAGACDIVTGLALRPARPARRLILHCRLVHEGG